MLGELSNMLHLFQDCPALVAPKFPMLLAALSMARTEVVWYFIHWERDLPAKVNNKAQIPGTYAALQISMLITLVHKLADLVKAKQGLVQRYYLEYLMNADRSDLEVQVEARDDDGVKGLARRLAVRQKRRQRVRRGRDLFAVLCGQRGDRGASAGRVCSNRH